MDKETMDKLLELSNLIHSIEPFNKKPRIYSTSYAPLWLEKRDWNNFLFDFKINYLPKENHIFRLSLCGLN